MVYLSADSTITLYEEPIAWASGYQMTAEKISLLTGNGQVKQFFMTTKAFMVGRRWDTQMFDQIKGRNMTGYFKDNELYMVYVDGSGETIYYPDDQGAIIGVNRATSSNIRIMIDKLPGHRHHLHEQTGRRLDSPPSRQSGRRTLERFPLVAIPATQKQIRHFQYSPST